MWDRDPLAAVGALGLPPLPALVLPLQRAMRVLLGRNLPPVDAMKRERFSHALVSDPTALATAIASIALKMVQVSAAAPSEATLSDVLDALQGLPELVTADAVPLNSLLVSVASGLDARSHMGTTVADVVPGDDLPRFRMKILDELPFSLDGWDLAALAVLLVVDCSVRLYQQGNHDKALIGYSAAASLSYALEHLSVVPEDVIHKVIGALMQATDIGRQRVNSRRGAEAKTQQRIERWALIKQQAIAVLAKRSRRWQSVNQALETLEEVRSAVAGQLGETTYKKILREISLEHPDLFVPPRRVPAT
ncbi:hypothetical protein R77591_04680 [Ralstonia mannitolilytica]|uniref:Uncharacterized protein n=2 Tax=Ralstonia mannitolilytica TaxID=105219 RepID=A0AAD2EPJ8_9RALS|nr:hypothetical protein R77591_04680 [Ralstonia mannitolilytica]CAJ0713406.1 hypothetical protein LMG8323_02242 [Ralstonia mannitolilytica]